MLAEVCLKNNYLNNLPFILENINYFSNDAIVVLNKEKEITNFSQKFKNILKTENILGKNFIEMMNKIALIPDDFFNEKFYFLRIKDDDLEKIIHVQINTLKNSINEIELYLIIMKNITKDEEMKTQKENFIDTITHDLKTPTRANILTLELLLNNRFGQLNKEQKEIIEEILKSNKFMMTMLDTLLSKYKYEHDKILLNNTIFDINKVVKECCDELKFLFEEKNIAIKQDFYNKKIEVNADIIEIRRAITNVISNAIKFNKEKGFVFISTYIKDNFATIEIKDTGIGMSLERQKHIFDKYISYAKKIRQLGTGLGLYVTKKIIEAHNGIIEFSSQENIGSDFIIKIPLNSLQTVEKL